MLFLSKHHLDGPLYKEALCSEAKVTQEKEKKDGNEHCHCSLLFEGHILITITLQHMYYSSLFFLIYDDTEHKKKLSNFPKVISK